MEWECTLGAKLVELKAESQLGFTYWPHSRRRKNNVQTFNHDVCLLICPSQFILHSRTKN